MTKLLLVLTGTAGKRGEIALPPYYGSDPTMMDVLGLKASQSHGIIDPFSGVGEQLSDESRIKKLAKNYLASLNKEVPVEENQEVNG